MLRLVYRYVFKQCHRSLSLFKFTQGNQDLVSNLIAPPNLSSHKIGSERRGANFKYIFSIVY